MKYLKRSFAAALVLMILAVSLVGCGKKNAVEERIGDLEAACRSMDVNGVLDTLNPSLANPIKLVVAATGSGETALEDLGAELLGSSDYDMKEVMESLDIEITKVKVDGKTAKAGGWLRFTANGTDFEQNVVFDLEQIDKKWFINSVSPGSLD